MSVNKRTQIAAGIAKANVRVATRLGLELIYSHQGAAAISIWSAKDDNALDQLLFPESGAADRVVNGFSIFNQPNLTFVPRTGDEVTIDGVLHFVEAVGKVSDYDSGFVIAVSKQTITQIGSPS